MLSFIRSKKVDKLISQRRGRLFRLAVSWCHDAMLADDLVQDTISKAIKNQAQIKDFKKLDGWLFRILHNTWMEYLRCHKPTMDIDKLEQLDEDTPEQILSEEQLVMKVQQAVSRLPVSQRQIITLVDLEGFSYAEVAVVLDIPMGTVMSRVSRARESLRKQLININRLMPEIDQETHRRPAMHGLRRVK